MTIETTTTVAPALAVHGVTKRYGRVTALDDVTIEVRPQEIVGLIGQNGAGKSTLLKVLSGGVQPDQGTIELAGSTVRLRSGADAARKGIGIVHQEQSLVPNLTVAENVHLGKRTAATRGGLVNWRRLYRDTEAQLAKLGCDFSPSARVDSLTFVQRQMVELTRALSLAEESAGSGTILLDEPTSLLSPNEVKVLFDELRRLREHTSVIFVSHRMDEVLEISDRVYVMSDGRVVAELRPDEVDERELYRLMVGEERAEDYYASADRARAAAATGPAVLSADLGLSASRHDIRLDVLPGRVLGIGGVVGSGRDEVVRLLYGLPSTYRGRVELDGREVRIHGPRQAIGHGIGYIPAERKVEGIVTGQSIARNLTYPVPRLISRLGVVSGRREKAIVRSWIDKLKIKVGAQRDDIASLSGGNQQKVVLARWLAVPHLKVLILDHPTRGLDLGAKADVYRQIREATANGLGVILLSDTLDELFGLSDDVLIMRDGRVSASYQDVQADRPEFELVVKEMV